MQASLALDVAGDTVQLTVSMGGRTLTPVLSAAQAREFADMMRRAAEVAEARGQPHGHA